MGLGWRIGFVGLGCDDGVIEIEEDLGKGEWVLRF